ncbi:MAG: DUF4380 domain-containing protein [Leptolyngbya sp. SIO3F4]|nr:DUF4380 domain-containing protein [Leptolyngbya sp. SIO3F4]
MLTGQLRKKLSRLGYVLTALSLVWLMFSNPVVAAPNQNDQGSLLRQGKNYVLQVGNLQFEVDPKHGAKVIAFRLDDDNILTKPSADPQNYGSTFWPSPQSNWEWPPITEIDSDPYTVNGDDLPLVMTSETSSEFGLQIAKKFSVDSEQQGITIEYTITNLSDKPQSFAPWEISRVRPDGLTFYPTGDAQLGSGPFEELTTEEKNGITWFEYNSQDIDANQKLYADGAEGWLAHVDGDKLLIKAFQDIPLERQAPTESEIEIFANASRPYIEIEQQGPYAKINPNESLSWKVDWYLRKLPSDLSPRVGSNKLVEIVRDIVAS